MSFPVEPILPTPTPPPAADSARARRRRAARQSMFPHDAEGQAAFISALARRAYPSLELFVLSLASGIIISLGFLLDSQAVILLGVLAAPMMTPWVGFLLSLFTSSPRFFFETFMALLISAVIVFLSGALTGFAARLFLPLTLTNVFIHARLWLPDLAMLAIGAVTLVASFARSEDKPFLPSVLLAYVFYLPISAGGFGLGSGVEGIFPQGLLVFVAHFALASFLGLMTLFFLKLKPTGLGLFLTVIALAASGALMFLLMSGGSAPAPQPATLTPPVFSPTASLSYTATLDPTATFTLTPAPTFTATFTPTVTLVPATEEDVTAPAAAVEESPAPAAGPPTPTEDVVVLPAATFTPTLSPQSVLGVIQLDEGGTANLRQTPNGKYIMPLENGTIVEVQPEEREVNGAQWVRVFATIYGRRLEGWLLTSVVSYQNPALESGVTPSP